jgi:hypothetical protein
MQLSKIMLGPGSVGPMRAVCVLSDVVNRGRERPAPGSHSLCGAATQ